MNIFLLTSSLGSGGSERVAAVLSSSWVKMGHSVTLIPTFSGGGKPFYNLDDRIELIYLADIVGLSESNNKFYIKRLVALRNMINLRRPDVVISFLTNVNIAALLATTFTGVPCVVCERTDPSMVPMALTWRIACRLLYRLADCVVVQTEAVASKIKHLYGGLRHVEVIANPLSPVLTHYASPRPVGDRKILLSLGRLSEEKRVDLIIDAFVKNAAIFSDWDLHIYGDGPLRTDLSRQIEKNGAERRIRLMGRTDDPWCVMSSSNAFVLASRFEGFPNALLEAMGLGLACVATDCSSGPREMTEDGTVARLVKVDDVDALQEGLTELMADDQLRLQLGRLASESVSKRYGLEVVLNRWDSLFGEVLMTNKSRLP